MVAEHLLPFDGIVSMGKSDAYIRTLKEQPEVIHDWNDTIWMVMVEKAIVHKDGANHICFPERHGNISWNIDSSVE